MEDWGCWQCFSASKLTRIIQKNQLKSFPSHQRSSTPEAFQNDDGKSSFRVDMKVRLCSHGEGCAICDADVIIQCQRGELHSCRMFANIFSTRNDRRERNKLFASTLSCSAFFHPLRSLSLVLFLLVPVDLMFIITLSRIFFHYKMSEQRTRREQKGMIKSMKYKNLW